MILRVYPVVITGRTHPFPYRTRQLSFLVPKILGWRRPGKIGRCRIYIKSCTNERMALFQYIDSQDTNEKMI